MALWAKKVLSSVRSWNDHVSREAGKVITFAMFGLITVDVLLRATTGKSTLIASEVSGYMLVALAILSLAHVQHSEGHVGIDLLTRLLPTQPREWLKLAVLSVSVVYVVWFINVTWSPVAYNYVRGVKSITILATPMWIPYLFVPVGGAMLLVELVAQTIRQARLCLSTRSRPPSPAGYHPRSG